MRTSRKHRFLGGLVLTTGMLAMPLQALATAPHDHPMVSATAPSPVVELLSRGSVAKPFEAEAHGIELEAERRIDVAVAHLTFAPGANTGWHKHPGPTVVTITSGELTVTDHHCDTRTFEAGDTFVEEGPPRHMALNTGDTTTETIVTFFVPRGAALTIPVEAPRCAR